jgi:hypothetical protein
LPEHTTPVKEHIVHFEIPLEPVPDASHLRPAGHGFGTGSCGFSGFQPCETANFKFAFQKLRFWESRYF